MTWTLLHDRMAFMAQVIKAAETDPEAALALIDKSSEVSDLFGDQEGLMLSLGQRWITMLVAKLDQAAHEGTSAEQVRADLEAAEPGLHALVKIGTRRSLRVRSLTRGEHVAVGLFGGPAGDRQTVA
jgi:ATP adenylyltransferase